MRVLPKALLLLATLAIAHTADVTVDVAERDATLSSPIAPPPPSPPLPLSPRAPVAAAASSPVSASPWPLPAPMLKLTPTHTSLRGASVVSHQQLEKEKLPPVPSVDDAHTHTHQHAHTEAAPHNRRTRAHTQQAAHRHKRADTQAAAHAHTRSQHADTRHAHVRVGGEEEHHPHPVRLHTGEAKHGRTADAHALHAETDLQYVLAQGEAGVGGSEGGEEGQGSSSGSSSPPVVDTNRQSGNNVCFPGNAPLVWTSEQHQLKVNGRVFHLKGANWFGFETQQYTLHGLNVRRMDEYLQFLRQNNFNALRIPFSLAFVQSYYTRNWGNYRDWDMNGMTRRDQLRKLIQRAGDYGILVMLDMHGLNDQPLSNELWYSDQYSEAAVIAGWDTILGDTMGYWNLFAVDLMNEPHGATTWGNSSPATDWNHAAERMAKHLLAKYGDKWKGLILVAGVNWSTYFRGWFDAPIDFGNPAWNQRMVLKPHQYGPSVFDSPGWYDQSFPENIPPYWEDGWGFLRWAADKAVVIGEWGGRYTGLDRTWGDRFASYLVDNCFSSQFYWGVNPNSKDTGGLLQNDWYTPERDKLNLLARVQPNPSWLTKTNGQMCFSPGAYANPQCASRNRSKSKHMQRPQHPIGPETSGSHKLVPDTADTSSNRQQSP